LSDRIEKIEKALITIEMICREVHFCSKEELENFKKEI
jgi:hypothetical protein